MYLRQVLALAAFFCGLTSAAEATPIISSNFGGGNGAPTSNSFTASLTSAPTAGDEGIIFANCSSTLAVPSGWASVYGSTTGTHVGTSNYLIGLTKTLSGSGDTSVAVTCNGTKYGYVYFDLSQWGVTTVGTLVTATSSAATGSVTYTVPGAGGLIIEIYEGFTASGSAATGITDSASVSTTASANDGTPGVSSQIIYSFASAADPFTGVTQPYTNSGTWNHSNSVLGSVDVYVAPATVYPKNNDWLPYPFNIWN